VHLELELRLKAGEAARAEEYLARYPELAGDTAALDLITAEHELRRRTLALPDPDLIPQPQPSSAGRSSQAIPGALQ
jgi:hypothetical protein